MIGNQQLEAMEAQEMPNRLPQMMGKGIQAEIRLGFVRKVYSILAVQLLLTAVLAAPISMATPVWLVQHVWLMWLGMGVYAALACVVCVARPLLRKFPMNYGVLFGLTVAMSIMVGFVSAQYTWQSVVLAAGMTALVFCGLTAYAWKTQTDFTGLGPYLFAFLLAMIVFGFSISVLSLSGVAVAPMILLYDLLGVLLFSFYTIYDTQRILGEYGGHKQQFEIDDYCLAALQLYLDIIELFLFLLELFGERRNR
mmetsp:Transcript_826/g.1824  ORF Transcript_826/g.1824 Transcript_826/m.1824 type:complete len:253 (+) Transcript_826:112-870(+)|eukprot:CAMPEP_0178386270 /NCGR_PEP_ID=MMETSP0689_2-20121128/8472_1 /TAXON_ID=160604 /ORGANISM="Amphidinium massartii, Strain CS-259" /LENGTH=252 /DNA_ID=CAMNT_0020006599 /DNA_START=24 /DNA_END=782 /DNA_ORIENTATION=-